MLELVSKTIEMRMTTFCFSTVIVSANFCNINIQHVIKNMPVLGISKLTYMAKFETLNFEIKSVTSSYSDNVYL